LLLLNTADKENNFNVGMPIPLIFLIGISTLFFFVLIPQEKVSYSYSSPSDSLPLDSKPEFCL